MLKAFLYFLLIFVLVLKTSVENLSASEILENQYLRISTNDQGWLAYLDKQNNVHWGSKHVGWVGLSNGEEVEKLSLSSSRINVEASGNAIVLQFFGIKGKILEDSSFHMVCRITLIDKAFEVEISNLTTRLIFRDVEYPAHLLPVKSGIDKGYIAIPHLQGILIPSRYPAGFMRYGQNIWNAITDQEKWWSFESGNLNMPWFGAAIGNSAFLVSILTASDCDLHILGNAFIDPNGFRVDNRSGQHSGMRLSSFGPIWKASREEFSYPRKLRIELVSDGYLGMAKRYKEYAKAAGRYVTLKEKIARNPDFEKIIGAPDLKIYCYTNRLNNPDLKSWSEPILDGYSKVNTTFDQVIQIANELEEMQVEKCLLLLAGWNRMGYDREHVDMWPPSAEAGGIEGLRQACEAVKKKGYLFALHDNYDDFYPDAPTYDEKYILRHKDGSLHQGGTWDGGVCYITCPAEREELLDRNMALIEKEIPLNAYYFDVITNTSHYECYDEQHPLTRKEDLNYRMQLLRNIAERGLLIGGERGTDWALPIVAFCEGLSGGGTGYHRGLSYRIGINVPLFYLVYRECVVGYWQHGTPYGREDHANHVLLDLLQGQPSSWSIEYQQWRDLKPLFKETYDLLGKLHEKTAHQAMVDHQFLSEDFMVQKSVFADGTEVWVNFGIIGYEQGAVSVPPKGFRLKTPGKPAKTAVVGRNIAFLQD